MIDLNSEKLIQFFHTISSLKHFTRRAVTLAGDSETVAAHSWGCTVLYSRLKRLFPAHNELEVYRLLVDHDLGECIHGDKPYDDYKNDPLKKLEKILEEETTMALLDDIICDMTPPIYPMTYYATAQRELTKQQTVESRIVRAIDVLEWNLTLYLALAFGAKEARDTALTFFNEFDWDARAKCFDEFPLLKMFNLGLRQKIKAIMTCVGGL